ncbi:ATP-binding cassette domain-containing protein [Spirochaetota bacterium]
MIITKNLTKIYNIKKKTKGLAGAVKGLITNRKTKKLALDNVCFTIKKGEIVGLIGPNGAGKSTTIKILTGILYPTSGSVSINGISPQKNRIEVVRKIGVVFGQRTQLYWDLRLGETFELLKRIYNIESSLYRNNLDEMDALFDIGSLLDIPVRQLSLGQRMKGDLVAAFLHSPELMVLDEPTIGLDLQAKRNIRKFIKTINAQNKTTIFLTTHDLKDINELCERLLVMNNGIIVKDGPLDSIVTQLIPYRVLVMDSDKPVTNITKPYCKILKTKDMRSWISFDRNKISAPELISYLAKKVKLYDFSVKEPDIEDVVSEIYKGQYNLK